MEVYNGITALKNSSVDSCHVKSTATLFITQKKGKRMFTKHPFENVPSSLVQNRQKLKTVTDICSPTGQRINRDYIHMAEILLSNEKGINC